VLLTIPSLPKKLWCIKKEREHWMTKKNLLRRTVRFRCIAALIVLLISATVSMLLGQVSNKSSLRLESGEQIYKAACVACHGSDGKGTPKAISGFEPPRTFPDFTQCDQTTPEDNPAWRAVITQGGPTRGFSQIMPSFEEALTAEQINQVCEASVAIPNGPAVS
jgi:hypothetical protein